MRLHVLESKIPEDVKKEHGILTLTLGQLEWFLQEALIFIILGQQFDQLKKSHLILADNVCGLSFDKKIKLINSHDLLSKDLSNKLDTIRKRRNVFIHGILLEQPDGLTISILRKNVSEDFTFKNCTEFKLFVEETGGQLVKEFEGKGFKLAA